MKKITIEIDMKKKAVINMDIPKEINPVQLVGILNSVENTILGSLQIEPKSKIEKPSGIILPNSN